MLTNDRAPWQDELLSWERATPHRMQATSDKLCQDISRDYQLLHRDSGKAVQSLRPIEVRDIRTRLSKAVCALSRGIDDLDQIPHPARMLVERLRAAQQPAEGNDQ
jgi:hypothetical protein